MSDTAGVMMLLRKVARDWGAEEARVLRESIMTTAPIHALASRIFQVAFQTHSVKACWAWPPDRKRDTGQQALPWPFLNPVPPS